MEKQPYIVPEIGFLDVQIEAGFAQSDVPQAQNTSAFNINDWGSGEF